MKRMALIVALVSLAWGCASGKKAQLRPGQMKVGSAEYLLNEGILNLNAGKLDIAEKKLFQALEKNPDQAAAMNALGLVYTYKRDIDRAISWFKKTITLDPNFYDAYNSLGMLYIERNEYDLAKENLLIAANAANYRTPENAFTNLALLEFNASHFDAALRYIDKGIATNKQFPPLYNLKAVTMEQLNRLPEAAENLEKALSLLTDPDVVYLTNLARIFQKMGEKTKALDLLEKALGRVLDPASKEAILQAIQDLEKSSG